MTKNPYVSSNDACYRRNSRLGALRHPRCVRMLHGLLSNRCGLPFLCNSLSKTEVFAVARFMSKHISTWIIYNLET